MKKLERLIYRLNQLDARRDWQGALKTAEELWEYPAYEEEIKEGWQRDAYINALFSVAEYFLVVGGDSYSAIAPLKRAYSLDDGHFVAAANSSAKEAAAFKLGVLYEKAKCHHSAVYWFRQSLSLARTSGVKENLLLNLDHLAGNLETLSLHKEASGYYDEVLEVLSDVPPLRQHLECLVHAAMYQIHYGDQARGEAVMRKLISATLGKSVSNDAPAESFGVWFYTALNALGMHYIATGRFQEAIKLARVVTKNAELFDKPDWVLDGMHGLIARANVHMGQLKRALKELAQVHDVETTTFIEYQGGILLENLELWKDIARIHVANHHYELAITAYEILAYHLGGFIGNRELADTTRLRFYWLQQMAYVVHEMVSVWLTITERQTRQAVEATVANALLQLKANLFIAMQTHKNLYESMHSLFMANRDYAIASRNVFRKPDDAEALLELEDTLFIREEIEKSSLSTLFKLPRAGALFRFDFREIQELEEGSLLLDYSLVNYQPPHKGLAGPLQGLRYIGIRLAKGSLQMVDLGEAQQIEALCGPLVQALSRQPMASEDSSGKPPNRRQLRPVDGDQGKKETDLDGLLRMVYKRIVAPFEPLSRSLLFSPDGMLAALPFHALIDEDRFLVEDRDVAYCHSLLQRESLSIRQLIPGARALPSISSIALLLGDPDYTSSGLRSLPGTKNEVAQVAKLLKKMSRDKKNVFDEVQIHTGAQATKSRLLGVDRPRILHIAAHGTFDEDNTRLFSAQPLRAGGYYRRWEEMGAAPFTQLDNALLNSIVMLAEDSESIADPVNRAALTALELASLNLFGCHVVVLSACETGVGVTEHGAGVLGFQYALQASCAKAGLLSLWKVLDHETSAFMVDLYQDFLNQESVKPGYAGYDVKAGYLGTVRKHCRRNGQRVHPYYWAAFVFLDQDYFNPVF